MQGENGAPCRNRTYNLVIKRVRNPVISRCRRVHRGNTKWLSVSRLGANVGEMLPSVTQRCRLLQVVYLLVYPTAGLARMQQFQVVRVYQPPIMHTLSNT